MLTNVVLQRFPTPVSTLSTTNATTPVTTPPISVMTPPAPPMTRRMAAKCQSKPTMKRKMTRLTARTNTEHCCNVCSTTFSTMEELQFHLEVFHLSINPSVVPPTGPQPCPHCGGKKFSNIVTHLSRFHSK